jgi:hypothetical protein
VIAELPVKEGAEKFITAFWLPAVADTLVGAPPGPGVVTVIPEVSAEQFPAASQADT